MIDLRTASYGAFVLRIALGALFLAHAAMKILVFTPAGTAAFFGTLGLPPALAYITIAVEVGGGIALILGFYTRWVSLALVPLLLGTIATVHGANGFFFTNANGGWEYPAFWALTLLVQASLGDGAFTMSRHALRTPAPAAHSALAD